MPDRGAIAAGDPQTCAAGTALLDAGGNAVDAVIAASLASCVCEPTLASPAGAGVLLSGSADRGYTLLDFFAPTPGLGAPKEAWSELDFFGVEVDFGATTQIFHIGRGSATVPTMIFGLLDAHRRYGRAPLRDVVEPAVKLAREGYELSKAVQWVFVLLKPILLNSEGTKKLYCLGNDLAPPGTRLDNPPMADFLEALAEGGDAWLRGDFADAVVANFGPGSGGLVTHEDIRRYQPVVREPLRLSFGDLEVLTNPPPSTGGALIAMGLRMAELAKLGDTEFLSVEHASMLAKILGGVSVARDSFDRSINEPGAVEALLARAADITERALGSTTHISVVDADGGAASLTVSNGEGCGYTLPSYGIHMNNFLGEEDINPHGFHVFEPGTWMTTMMSPTIVVKDGHPRLVAGSGGSNRIRSAVLEGLLNVLAFDRPLIEAVSAPRMHVEGKRLWFEADGLAPGAAATLQREWDKSARFDAHNMFFGGVHTVGVDDEGAVHAAGDPRRGGSIGFSAQD